MTEKEHVCCDCDWTGESRESAEEHERETGHVTVRREDEWRWSDDWGD